MCVRLQEEVELTKLWLREKERGGKEIEGANRLENFITEIGLKHFQ